MDFGWVLGGFWEAQIHDFRIFFVYFSMQNLDCNLEGQKIEKKGLQGADGANLPLRSGHPPPGWGEKERGQELLITDLIVVQHASHTFGGRRIETPRGGHCRPPTLWRSSHLVMELLFCLWAFLAFAVPNMTSKTFENEARTLQNGGPGP